MFVNLLQLSETDDQQTLTDTQMTGQENKLQQLDKRMWTTLPRIFVMIPVGTTTATGKRSQGHQRCLNSKHKRPIITQLDRSGHKPNSTATLITRVCKRN
jgi:hypothetical protein